MSSYYYIINTITCLHLWKEIVQLFMMVNINCQLDNIWNHMGYGHLGMPVGLSV